MQNPSAIRTKSKAAATPARDLSWSFMLLVIACACAIAVGFFFAARQHFNSMDFGIKNSKLREQLQNLETEKRRLLLAREVALSPLAIKKAATQMGMRQASDMTAIQVAAKQDSSKAQSPSVINAKVTDSKSASSSAIVRTVLTTPAQAKSNGEVRGRIVDSGRDRKEKTEVAALLKLR